MSKISRTSSPLVRGAPLVKFGNTDLWVSRLCQGTAFRHLRRTPNELRGQRVLRHCIEQGINFFDSAALYGWGGAEEALGRAIRGTRDRVVICTKVAAFHPPEKDEAELRPARFTSDYLFQQAEESLRRLGTDYLDIYLLHQPDPCTPAEDIVIAMDRLVRRGHIRYWGVSNHSAARVREFVTLTTDFGLSPIAALEEYFNVAGEARIQRLEAEMFPVVRDASLGLLAYSPLDAGQLAPDSTVDVDAPLAGLIKVLDEVASGLMVSRTSLCVAWVLTHPEVTSVLAGAESMEHVDQNLAGARMELKDDVLATLNAASIAYRDAHQAESK